MKLLVDAGNSRVKWAWLEGGALHDPGAELHGGTDFAAVAQAIAARGSRPTAIVLASVLAPPLTEALNAELAAALGVRPKVALTEIAAAGVRNGYHDHRQLGVDRWLAILAAYNFARTAVCVVDAGTAVTIDAVAADGSHRGGYIVPGPGLMRYSLLRDTSGIRSAADRLPTAPPSPAAWGRDTESCIRRGSLRAVACLVEDCMKALLRDEGRGSLVLTGGDADALGGELSLAVEYRPLLVLEGLALRYGGG